MWVTLVTQWEGWEGRCGKGAFRICRRCEASSELPNDALKTIACAAALQATITPHLAACRAFALFTASRCRATTVPRPGELYVT